MGPNAREQSQRRPAAVRRLNAAGVFDVRFVPKADIHWSKAEDEPNRRTRHECPLRAKVGIVSAWQNFPLARSPRARVERIAQTVADQIE